MKTAAIVTTSWDDGDPLDLRLADLLSRYGVKGTFYVPSRANESRLMSHRELRELQATGMEIGAHTRTHPVLTGLSDHLLWREVRGCKPELEDVIGRQVTAFCYPRGKWNPRVRRCVEAAGYELARTTAAFRTKQRFQPASMPTALHFSPHTRLIHARHALIEGNIAGFVNWMRIGRCASDSSLLGRRLAAHVFRNGGIFHLWGHSWEIDRLGMWHTLEELLKELAGRSGVLYLTNGELYSYLRRAGGEWQPTEGKHQTAGTSR